MPDFICPMCFAGYEKALPLCEECETKLVEYNEFIKTADLKELKEIKKSLSKLKICNEDDRTTWIKRVEDLINDKIS
jgi:hypothetical protein